MFRKSSPLSQLADMHLVVAQEPTLSGQQLFFGKVIVEGIRYFHTSELPYPTIEGK
jgi:hypothetical protein